MSTDVKMLTGPVPLIWPAAFAATAFIGSLAYACIFPFVAIAVIAAATLSSRGAIATVAASWAVNQLIGFALMDYPHTQYTVTWGLAIGVASVAATIVATSLVGDRQRPLRLTALGMAFAAAFLVYEGVLFVFSLYAGGIETFSAEIVGLIAQNDALWLLGFIALRLALAHVAPRWFRQLQGLRFA